MYISEILAENTLQFHVCSYLRNGGYEVEVEDVITNDGNEYLNLNNRICVVTKLCRFAGVYSEKCFKISTHIPDIDDLDIMSCPYQNVKYPDKSLGTCQAVNRSRKYLQRHKKDSEPLPTQQEIVVEVDITGNTDESQLVLSPNINNLILIIILFHIHYIYFIDSIKVIIIIVNLWMIHY